MEKNNMKNIVVLKNLPSNLVDEAIVILKKGVKAKSFEKIDKKTKSENRDKTNSKDYIIKEAEMVVANYISTIEQKRTIKRFDKNLENKYKKLKMYSIWVTCIMLLTVITNIIF